MAIMPKNADFYSRRLLRQLVLIFVALNLMVYIAGSLWLIDSRVEYQERAKLEAENISRILALNMVYVFDKIELLVMDAEGKLSQQLKAGTLDNRTIAPYLASLEMRVPELNSLRATDADGTLIYGHGMPTDPPTNVSKDSHFPFLRDHPDAGTRISKPKFGRINKAWVIKVSRRYNKPDGSFAGVVNGTMRLENLLALVPELDIGLNGFISLRDSDLGIIFRVPQPGIGKDIGQREVPLELRRRVEAQHESASFISVSPVDGIERTYALNKVGKWGIYLTVGLASQDYLAKWRQELRLVIMTTGIFTILSICIATLIYRNILDRSRFLAQLQEQQTVFRSLAEISSDWFWEQDGEHRFTSMTRELSYRTGSEEGDFIGKKRWEFAVEPDEAAWEKHRAILDAHQPFQDFEYSFVDNQDRKHTVSVSGSPMFDTNGEFIGYRGTAKDITERREYELRIQNMAQYDNLTGLPNRVLFYDRLNQAISLARRNQHRFALLYLDLDKFKPVNDTYGHDIGDHLLKAVVQRMEFVLRESDTLARLGGDEFAVIMPRIDSLSDPAAVAEKVIEVIVEPFHLGGITDEVVIGISIGIAVFPDDAALSSDLVRAADQAMYCAKREGNHYRVYAECSPTCLSPGSGGS